MSAHVESESSGTMIRCASCGIAEDDDIKLKKCATCGSVRYCGEKCQKEHRPQHERECKKRAAELRDEILFKQPESSHLGDCPICYLPLSLDANSCVLAACCSKIICIGCNHANQKQQWERSLKSTCPFCRHPAPTSQAEAGMIEKNRIEANDPVAMCQMGKLRYEEGNFKSAVEYFSKAAEMDNVEAHYGLSVMYREGHGFEKDKKKEVYHLEQAAIGGHDLARHNLGCDEEDNGRHERAVKHYIIGANLGNDRSLVALKDYFTRGLLSKEDFATALRAHQAAIDATKSPQRMVGGEFVFQ
jgi:tetratricopeptide (TPR) repeat protein